MFYLATWQNSVLHWHQSHISMEIQYALEEQPEIINWCLISLRMVGAAWFHLSIWLKLAIMKMLRLMAMLRPSTCIQCIPFAKKNLIIRISLKWVMYLCLEKMSPEKAPRSLFFSIKTYPSTATGTKQNAKLLMAATLRSPPKKQPLNTSPDPCHPCQYGWYIPRYPKNAHFSILESKKFERTILDQ